MQLFDRYMFNKVIAKLPLQNVANTDNVYLGRQTIIHDSLMIVLTQLCLSKLVMFILFDTGLILDGAIELLSPLAGHDHLVYFIYKQLHITYTCKNRNWPYCKFTQKSSIFATEKCKMQQIGLGNAHFYAKKIGRKGPITARKVSAKYTCIFLGGGCYQDFNKFGFASASEQQCRVLVSTARNKQLFSHKLIYQ